MGVWEERAGRNEALFREVNENIAELEERLDSGNNWLPVICECAQADCVTQIRIRTTEYVAVRRHPHRFIVARGHEQEAIEQVVAQGGPEYVIVEKLGAAAEAANEIPV